MLSTGFISPLAQGPWWGFADLRPCTSGGSAEPVTPSTPVGAAGAEPVALLPRRRLEHVSQMEKGRLAHGQQLAVLHRGAKS